MWRLARATGTTPWAALHDPHVAFNVTALRAYDKAQEMRMLAMLESLKSGDEFGIARVLGMLQLVLEA